MTCGFRAKIWIHVMWLPKPVFLGCLPGAIKIRSWRSLFSSTQFSYSEKSHFLHRRTQHIFYDFNMYKEFNLFVDLTHVLTSWYWKCGISFELGGSAPWPGEDNRTLRFPRILSQKNIGINCHFHRIRREGDFRSVAFKVPFSFEVLDAPECRMPKKKKKSSFYFISLCSSLHHTIAVICFFLTLYFCFSWYLYPNRDDFWNSKS